MENTSMWDWDNADARIVSSVYRDAETETETQIEKTTEAINIEETPTETKNQSEPETMKAVAESGTTTQHVETNTTESQSAQASQPADVPPVNAFILVDEPQSSAPQKEASFTQPEFQPIVLFQNIQQEQGEKRQRSAQSTNYQSSYSDKDISENKITAIAAYLLGPLGIIIALLMSAESPYAKFHVRQALKLTVSSVVLEIFAAVFALFGMIPFVGIIFKLVFVLIGAAWLGVLVLRLIAIAQVCDGEAREPAVVGSFNFFK